MDLMSFAPILGVGLMVAVGVAGFKATSERNSNKHNSGSSSNTTTQNTTPTETKKD